MFYVIGFHFPLKVLNDHQGNALLSDQQEYLDVGVDR